MVFNTDGGPASWWRFRTCATASAWLRTPSTSWTWDEPLPKLSRAPRPLVAEADFATSATAWLTAGAAHHTVLTTAVGMDVFEDFAEIARPNCSRSMWAPRSSSSRRN